MSPSLRLTTVLVCGILAVRSAAPVFSLASLDVWNWPQAWWSLARAQEEATSLDNSQSRMMQSYCAKRALGAELADGRVTLAEAVGKFRQLVSNPNRFLHALRDVEPGSSDEERLWRHVIDWAAMGVAEHPERRAALLARLEDELQRHLSRPSRPPLAT